MELKEAREILEKEIDGIPEDLDTGKFTEAVRLAIKSMQQIEMIKFNVWALTRLLKEVNNEQ